MFSSFNLHQIKASLALKVSALMLSQLFQRPNFFAPSVSHLGHFEQVLGTSLELRIRANTLAQALRAEQTLLGEIERLEQIFSRFMGNSELNRFLAFRDTPFLLSPELEYVLKAALDWQERSGGAFQLGADALAQVWKTAAQSQIRPTKEILQPILEQLKQPLLEFGNGYGLHRSSLGLNCNAIAKGFIADRAAQVAYASAGVQEVLVNLGGDLLHLGKTPIKASIANPYTHADNAAPLDRLELCHQGLATSGSTHRGYDFLDGRVSHVFDPRTGQPASHVLSASVIAPDAMTADALSTIFAVLVPEQSLELANSLPDVGCLIVTPKAQFRNPFWNTQRI